MLDPSVDRESEGSSQGDGRELGGRRRTSHRGRIVCGSKQQVGLSLLKKIPTKN